MQGPRGPSPCENPVRVAGSALGPGQLSRNDWCGYLPSVVTGTFFTYVGPINYARLIGYRSICGTVVRQTVAQ